MTELLQQASRAAYGPDVVRGELAPVVERLGLATRFTPLVVAGVVGVVGGVGSGRRRTAKGPSP